MDAVIGDALNENESPPSESGPQRPAVTELIGSIVEIAGGENGSRYLVLGLVHARGDLMASLRKIHPDGDFSVISEPVRNLRRVTLPILTAWDAVCATICQVLAEPRPGLDWRAAFARADFKAYQFRPLLKFFGSARRRLLLADETGLGKTVESGYVILECLARDRAQRVLVVVPPRLKNKWRAELRVRFGLSFTEFGSFKSLLRALGDPRRPFLGIVSIDSGRSGDLEELYSLLGTRDFEIDLLVLDESHEIIGRGRDTIRRNFVEALSLLSHGVLGLSATPVHLEMDDLGRILQVIHPGLLSDERFEREIELTALVNQVARSLINGFASLPPEGVRDTESRVERLRLLSTACDESERASLRRFLENLPGRQKSDIEKRRLAFRDSAMSATLIGSHLSRTRAVEVGEYRARAVRTLRIVLDKELHGVLRDGTQQSASESSLFGDIDALLSRSFSHVHRSQLASSLPAILDLLRAGTLGVSRWMPPGGASSVSLPRELNGDDLGEADRRECQRIVDLAGLLTVDTKWENLRECVHGLENDDGVRKALLFTHWIPTYNYLARRLRSGGDIPWYGIPPSSDDNEITATLRRFAEQEGFALLLMTDMMKEGFDLDAADCVINYDLPYNPQVIEQRIGRVDRVSQVSSRIVVLNLLVDGSLDEEVYDTVLSRIGAFERVVGEMRPITAEMVREIETSKVVPREVVQAELDAAVRNSLMEHEVFRGVEGWLDDQIRLAHDEQSSWPAFLRWTAVSRMLSLLVPGSRCAWDENTRELTFRTLSDDELDAIRELSGRAHADEVMWALSAFANQNTDSRVDFAATKAGVPLSHPLVQLAVAVARKSYRDPETPVPVIHCPRERLGLEGATSLICLVRFDTPDPGSPDFSVRLYSLSAATSVVQVRPSHAPELLLCAATNGFLAERVSDVMQLELAIQKGCQDDYVEWCATVRESDRSDQEGRARTRESIIEAGLARLSQKRSGPKLALTEAEKRLKIELAGIREEGPTSSRKPVGKLTQPPNAPKLLLTIRPIGDD